MKINYNLTICKKHNCTINDMILTLLTTSLDVCRDASSTTSGVCNNLKTEEASLMVVINLRDPPNSVKEMKKAGNQLHYEIIRFPITSDLTPSLTRIKS